VERGTWRLQRPPAPPPASRSSPPSPWVWSFRAGAWGSPFNCHCYWILLPIWRSIHLGHANGLCIYRDHPWSWSMEIIFVS
jgi:hypothetical protein